MPFNLILILVLLIHICFLLVEEIRKLRFTDLTKIACQHGENLCNVSNFKCTIIPHGLPLTLGFGHLVSLQGLTIFIPDSTSLCSHKRFHTVGKKNGLRYGKKEMSQSGHL